MVLIDHFPCFGNERVLKLRWWRWGLRGGVRVDKGTTGSRRPVESPVPGIGTVQRCVHRRVPSPQPLMMKRGDKCKALITDRPAQLAHNVPARTHAGCVPAIHLRIPHGKAVAMFRNRSGKFCSRLTKQLRPFLGIELLRVKPGNEVLVSELRRRPTRGYETCYRGSPQYTFRGNTTRIQRMVLR